MYKTIYFIISIFFTTSVFASEVEFEKVYSQGVKSIYLASNESYYKSDLSNFGYSTCGEKSFCVIWFFDDPKKSKFAAKQMMSGNTWDPIPGLIAIYSKNKKINKLI